MGFFRYYCKVLQVAFSHSLGIAESVVFVVTIAGGLAAYFLPQIKMAIHFSEWQIAAVVLGSIVGIRLLLAPYWV